MQFSLLRKVWDTGVGPQAEMGTTAVLVKLGTSIRTSQTTTVYPVQRNKQRRTQACQTHIDTHLAEVSSHVAGGWLGVALARLGLVLVVGAYEAGGEPSGDGVQPSGAGGWPGGA